MSEATRKFPAWAGPFTVEERRELLQSGEEWLSDLQAKLYLLGEPIPEKSTLARMDEYSDGNASWIFSLKLIAAVDFARAASDLLPHSTFGAISAIRGALEAAVSIQWVVGAQIGVDPRPRLIRLAQKNMIRGYNGHVGSWDDPSKEEIGEDYLAYWEDQLGNLDRVRMGDVMADVESSSSPGTVPLRELKSAWNLMSGVAHTEPFPISFVHRSGWEPGSRSQLEMDPDELWSWYLLMLESLHNAVLLWITAASSLDDERFDPESSLPVWPEVAFRDRKRAVSSD